MRREPCDEFVRTRSNDLNKEETQPPKRASESNQDDSNNKETATTKIGGGAGLTADGDVLGVGIGDGRRDLLDVERALALHVQAGTERHDDHLAATHRPPDSQLRQPAQTSG